jgi:predicted XRE-type DNA-binding protein
MKVVGHAQVTIKPRPPRANLMSDLRLYIEKHKLTQSDAAKRLGIAQSRVRPHAWQMGQVQS